MIASGLIVSFDADILERLMPPRAEMLRHATRPHARGCAMGQAIIEISNNTGFLATRRRRTRAPAPCRQLPRGTAGFSRRHEAWRRLPKSASDLRLATSAATIASGYQTTRASPLYALSPIARRRALSHSPPTPLGRVTILSGPGRAFISFSRRFGAGMRALSMRWAFITTSGDAIDG